VRVSLRAVDPGTKTLKSGQQNVERIGDPVAMIGHQGTNQLARFGDRNQRDDNAGPQHAGGVVGLNIDDVTLIIRQPEQIVSSHRGSEFPILRERNAVSLDRCVPGIKTRGIFLLPAFGPFAAHLGCKPVLAGA